MGRFEDAFARKFNGTDNGWLKKALVGQKEYMLG